MTLQEAIQVRHSVRQYKDTAIEAEKIAQLQALIDECNRVEAKPNYLLIGSYVHIDLGIVKYHFEVAAGKENFEWINTRVVID